MLGDDGRFGAVVRLRPQDVAELHRPPRHEDDERDRRTTSAAAAAARRAARAAGATRGDVGAPHVLLEHEQHQQRYQPGEHDPHVARGLGVSVLRPRRRANAAATNPSTTATISARSRVGQSRHELVELLPDALDAGRVGVVRDRLVDDAARRPTETSRRRCTTAAADREREVARVRRASRNMRPIGIAATAASTLTARAAPIATPVRIAREVRRVVAPRRTRRAPRAP